MNDDLDVKTKKEPDSLRTVQRALEILNCFTLENVELTLTEIAKKISLAKSTTTRLLATLEQNGYVMKEQETLKYRLGHKLYYLGYIAGKSIDIRQLAIPSLKKLRDNTKETVNLYLLENEYRVCVEQFEGLQNLRHMVKIGEKLPLWAGAGGKVLLAFQDHEFQQRIFRFVDSLEKLDRLKNELKIIQKEGWASSRDEREVGSSAVAAPIFDIDGKVRVCISVSGPTHRYSLDVIKQLRTLVKQEAAIISMKNGYLDKEFIYE